MIHFRDLLKSEGIDLSMLDSDTRAWIKEYETIEKAKLPTIRDKTTGEFTPNAQAKLNRLNKTIVNEIAEFIAERDSESDAAAEVERKRLEDEQAAQKKADDEAAEIERKRLEDEQKLQEEADKKKKSRIFSSFLGE